MTLSKKPERDCDSMEVRLYNRGWNAAIDAITSLPAKQQEPSAGGIIFAVEEAIRNGDCPWQIEQAFDKYEADRIAAHNIKGAA